MGGDMSNMGVIYPIWEVRHLIWELRYLICVSSRPAADAEQLCRYLQVNMYHKLEYFEQTLILMASCCISNDICTTIVSDLFPPDKVC